MCQTLLMGEKCKRGGSSEVWGDLDRPPPTLHNRGGNVWECYPWLIHDRHGDTMGMSMGGVIECASVGR